MPTVHAAQLTSFVARIFQAAGAPPDAAELVAASLVKSNLAGHDSHGVVRVIQYLASMAQGEMDAQARPTLVRETPVTATVDGNRGFGQLAAHFAASLALEKAQAQGLGAVALAHAGHIGRVGEWVEMAGQAGFIGLAWCNGGRPGGIVAPFGGAERRLGTNPVAAAVPLPGEPPLVMDFATSVVAEGKVRIARNSGKPIPEGWILDREGRPSTRPQDLYDGGVLLPAAGHKGYGLSLLVELLGGVLTGAGCPIFPGYVMNNGVLFLVLDPGVFRPREAFDADVRRLVEAVRSTRPAPGFQEVLLPGEPERRTAQERQAQGIPMDETTWQGLLEAGARFGVAWDAET